MFYKFDQNNSGGEFNGPKYVIVEADDEDEAMEIAVGDGDVYFDGVDKGIDCPCCGDRWSSYCDRINEEDIPKYKKSLILRKKKVYDSSSDD